MAKSFDSVLGWTESPELVVKLEAPEGHKTFLLSIHRVINSTRVAALVHVGPDKKHGVQRLIPVPVRVRPTREEWDRFGVAHQSIKNLPEMPPPKLTVQEWVGTPQFKITLGVRPDFTVAAERISRQGSRFYLGVRCDQAGIAEKWVPIPASVRIDSSVPIVNSPVGHV